MAWNVYHQNDDDEEEKMMTFSTYSFRKRHLYVNCDEYAFIHRHHYVTFR